VSPTNAKTLVFGPQDGQFRVNFKNKQAFGGDVAVVGNRVTSAARIVPGGYLVEMRIALGGKKLTQVSTIGLELQVNDATGGTRTAVRTWADPSGLSYQDTSNWGVAEVSGTVAAPALKNVTAPSISGPGRVGSTLTSTPGTWSEPAPTLAYQWTRDGAPIAGATAPTYRLTAGDAGAAIALTVTAAKDGFTPAAASSKAIAVAKVRSSISGSVNHPITFTGRGIVYTAQVRASGVNPTGTVTVYDSGRPIATAKLPAAGSRIAIPLPRLRSGVHVLVGRYSGSDQVQGSIARPHFVFVFLF